MNTAERLAFIKELPCVDEVVGNIIKTCPTPFESTDPDAHLILEENRLLVSKNFVILCDYIMPEISLFVEKLK